MQAERVCSNADAPNWNVKMSGKLTGTTEYWKLKTAAMKKNNLPHVYLLKFCTLVSEDFQENMPWCFRTNTEVINAKTIAKTTVTPMRTKKYSSRIYRPKSVVIFRAYLRKHSRRCSTNLKPINGRGDGNTFKCFLVNK